MSVFNDDKKTELIGEAWIDLRDIIVTGGGQSDHWHQLGCRGKYAGEVRIEITYYDARPKPEKPVVKAKPSNPAEAEASPGVSGPRAVPKRRPLPSDPVTGKAPALPSSAPEPVELPPRPQQNPAPPSSTPTQPSPHQAEYNTGPPAASQTYYQPDHDPRRQPSREFGTPSRRVDAPAQQYRTPEGAEKRQIQNDDQGYSPNYQPPGHDRYDSNPHDSYGFPQADDTRDFEDDRPPPPPAHRSRTGSNPTMNAAFQSGFDLPAKGTPPTMRHDVLRNEAHRHSASASYPGRPTYKASDSAPAALTGSQYSSADQPPPPRHYSYDSSYDMPQRTMQATVEDVPESPESMSNNGFRRTSGRWPQSQSQPQFDLTHDMSVSPAPLNLGGRGGVVSARYPQSAAPPDLPRNQGPNGYQMPSSGISQRETPEYSNFGRHSEPSLGSHGSHGDQRALTYRSELGDTSNGYSVPPVPPSLVPGIDPNIAQEISERISQDRKQVMDQTRRYTQQAPVETPPRGRTMDPRYDHDGSMVPYNAPPPAHGRSPMTYTNGPSTSSVNVLIKSRAYSPNPVRDPSPNPHHQHTIRRKSVSPRPPMADNRSSSVPFGPDSYDSLNPNTSSSSLKDAASSRPDYHEASGKIITHDGREVDPSDHLPMETWAPEPEPKKPTPSASPSARPSPSGAQPQPSSGRRALRIAGRPQSMLPSTSGGGYIMSDHVEPVTPSPPVQTGRNRLQKKAAYRTSTSAIVPIMSGANGSGSVPNNSNSSNAYRRNSGAAMEHTPLAPLPQPHVDNFTPPRHLSRASTFDYAGGENYAPNGVYGTSPDNRGHGHGHHRSHSQGRVGDAPPIPAKVPLALPPPGGNMSGAMQLHSSSVARRAGGGLDDGYYEHDGYEGGHGGGHGGYGGRGDLSLEEELRSIDIGTGRSSRRRVQPAYGQAGGYGHGY